MNDEIDDIDADEADVPQLAVDALNAAQRRAMEPGQEVVLVRDRKLIRITPTGEEIVLKTLPPLEKIVDRVKRAKRD